MAKYYGKIGYICTEETSPGIWTEREIEPKFYYGDILSDVRRWDTSDQVNDNLRISNRISILADPFAFENVEAMKWIEYMGAKWKISSVEVSYPRLVLTLGDVYNG